MIRFELMFDSWCLNCGIHIGQGTRYNAEKKEVDKYFTTPIYEFQMKCTSCPQIYVIRTNPKDATYDYISGIRKKEKDFDTADIGTMVYDEDQIDLIRKNKMQYLEKGKEEYDKALDNAPSLERIVELRKEQSNTEELLDIARDMFRTEKKQSIKEKETVQGEMKREGINHHKFKINKQKKEDIIVPEILVKPVKRKCHNKSNSLVPY